MKSVFAIAALCFAVSLHFESAQADPYISEMEHDLNTVKADLEQLLQGAKVLGEDDDAGRRGGKKGFLSTAGSFTLSSGANQQVHAALKATNKAISAVHKAKKSKSSSCPKCVCGSKKAAKKKPAKKKKFSLFKKKPAKKKPAKKKSAKKKPTRRSRRGRRGGALSGAGKFKLSGGSNVMGNEGGSSKPTGRRGGRSASKKRGGKGKPAKKASKPAKKSTGRRGGRRGGRASKKPSRGGKGKPAKKSASRGRRGRRGGLSTTGHFKLSSGSNRMGVSEKHAQNQEEDDLSLLDDSEVY